MKTPKPPSAAAPQAPRITATPQPPQITAEARRASFSATARLPRRAAALGAALAALAILGAPTAAGAAGAPEPPPQVHAAAPGAGGESAAATVCDAGSSLTLIGMDTRAGEMLFAVPGAGGGAEGGWIVALDGAGQTAHGYPDRGGHYSGSVGPGPVIAVESCGAACVQPLRWNDGSWQTLGDSLTLPAGSTLAATYDESGAPWLMAHAPGGKPGLFKAWGYRYEGREWKSRGGIEVGAVGQPQVTPAPQRRDGVLSGTGLFAAGDPPTTWVQGLPGVSADRRGQLIALTGAEAAYVSADGIAYLSADSGKSWRRSTWTPWGGDTTGMWRQGNDYGIDLPVSDHRGILRLVWYDRRIAASEKVVLTRLGLGGAWTQLAAVPADVTSKNGEKLPVSQVLVPSADTWVLLSGCATTAAGPGLVLRTVAQGVAAAPRFVPITLATPGAAAPPP